jgi:SAM-dependent methyltransferase
MSSFPNDGASLHFVDESFDLVISRFAVHYFPEPHRRIGETTRVCRAGVLDLIAAEPALATLLGELERRRDHSHTDGLPTGALAGVWLCESQRSISTGWSWPACSAVASPAPRIRSAEIEGGTPNGLRPHRRDGDLYLTQRWAIFAATKAATSEEAESG